MSENRILSLESLRVLEQRAQAAGYNLMQRAAMATADWVSHHLPPGSRLLVCAGPGNNGGDALYAAQELLQRRFAVDILVPTQPTSPATAAALQQLESDGCVALFDLPRDYAAPALVIDGLFGVGLNREIDSEWASLIERINLLHCPILALDCPSGVDAYSGSAGETAICASHTLTFLCHKPGLFCGRGADLSGKVELAALDCPPALVPPAEGELSEPDVGPLARPLDSHKGSFGTVSVIGGAPGMLGAALLAGRSALANGAGKVYVCPLDDRLPVDPVAPELMIRALDAITQLPPADVVALGPGLGQQELAARLVEELAAQAQPLVLDADALNLLAVSPAAKAALARREHPAILTPHPAEAARLLGIGVAEVQRNRLLHARRLAVQYHSVVVLKGAGSLTVRPDGYYRLNTTGGPELASAGQGDVLTGLIAALLAQGLDAFDASSLAVYLHGMAGDEYQLETGGPIGLAASDTAWRSSLVLNRLLREQQLRPAD
ncbi:bifunctional ADP-dependent NAD(P)H-hydrate dehydratase/NAD(P)H-hydrate epimerase [Xenophilus sp. AP218F]|nr:bifunctional ADP-dependent NAD(P)H-hydrate dehydratase/NAD(P)H-hydrate epimerase [Xenophilus sp. AP218F]